MNATKHSMQQAVEIQRAFEHRYAHEEGVVGVGIGLNRGRDDLAINVYVTRKSCKDKLPGEFDGLDVIVDVVEGFRAL